MSQPASPSSSLGSTSSRFVAQLVSAIVCNIFLRLLTFGLSTWVTRSLRPSQAGLSFSYQVYVDAVLFVSREAIRNVTSRYRIRQEDEDIRADASPSTAATSPVSHEKNGKTEKVFAGKTSAATTTGFFALDGRRVAALVNTAALAIPACVGLMLVVELCGGLVVPVLPWLLSAVSAASHKIGVTLHHTVASPAVANTSTPEKTSVIEVLLLNATTTTTSPAPFTVSTTSSLSSWTLFPSLSKPLWEVWRVTWAYHRMNSSSTTLTSRALHWVATCSHCVRMAIPELLVWSSLAGMAVVEPVIAVLTSLDLFRTVVLAEGTTMIVRLSATLLLLHYLVGSSEAPSSTTTFTNSMMAEEQHALQVQMRRMELEWRVRLVFGCGFLLHTLTTLLYYLLACNGPRWCRGLCGTQALQPPAPPPKIAEDQPTASAATNHHVGKEEGAGMWTSNPFTCVPSSPRVGGAASHPSGSDPAHAVDTTMPSKPMEDEETEAVAVTKEKCQGRTEKLERASSVSSRFPKGSVPFPFCLSYFPWSYLHWRWMRQALQHHFVLLWTFLRESLIRLALSEGTNLALLSVSDAASRGCYQTITRLGALVTRLLFRIWENACQSHWSRLLHDTESSSSETPSSSPLEDPTRAATEDGTPPSSAGSNAAGDTGARADAAEDIDATVRKQREAVLGLQRMLRLSLYIGFASSWMGPLFARPLLVVLYSGRWISEGLVQALQYYCHTIGPMAWNGLLECFIRAVGDPDLLRRQQYYTVVISIVFVVSSYLVLLAIRMDQDAMLHRESGGRVALEEVSWRPLPTAALDVGGFCGVWGRTMARRLSSSTAMSSREWNGVVPLPVEHEALQQGTPEWPFVSPASSSYSAHPSKFNTSISSTSGSVVGWMTWLVSYATPLLPALFPLTRLEKLSVWLWDFSGCASTAQLPFTDFLAPHRSVDVNTSSSFSAPSCRGLSSRSPWNPSQTPTTPLAAEQSSQAPSDPSHRHSASTTTRTLPRSEGGSDSCDKTEVVETLLVLHRWNMVFRIVVSFALLLGYGRRRRHEPVRPPKFATATSSALKTPLSSSSRTPPQASARFRFGWREVYDVLPSPLVLCALGLLFWISRLEPPTAATTTIRDLPESWSFLARWLPSSWTRNSSFGTAFDFTEDGGTARGVSHVIQLLHHALLRCRQVLPPPFAVSRPSSELVASSLQVNPAVVVPSPRASIRFIVFQAPLLGILLVVVVVVLDSDVRQMLLRIAFHHGR